MEDARCKMQDVRCRMDEWDDWIIGILDTGGEGGV